MAHDWMSATLLLQHLGPFMGIPKLMGSEVGGVFERIFETRRKSLPRWVKQVMPVTTFAEVIAFTHTVAWFSLLLSAECTTLGSMPAAGSVAVIILPVRVITRLLCVSAVGLAVVMIPTISVM